MDYTHNKKIMQITETTLIVGVDIAKEHHVARAQDFRGIEFDKPIQFENTWAGMESFLDWATKIAQSNSKDSIIVGMEPTGHYWFNFAQYLKDYGIKVVLVNPFHVKRSKEFDDNCPTKSDLKDPRVIAQLVKDGRYVEPHIPEGVYSDLRVAVELREGINKTLGRVKNKVTQWLDRYFPEFSQVFNDWEGKAALMTLKQFPTPTKIVELGPEEITKRWRTEVKRAVGIKRAAKLVNIAKESVGIREGLTMAEYELKSILEQYELLAKQLSDVEIRIEDLALNIPGVKEMLTIKGVGIITVAGFMAEVGDLFGYDHPNQIQKLAGLNLRENSSGKHKGQTTITKRGRRRLRSVLFRAIMPLVATNEQFKELHRYYTTRKENPLKKKQSLIVLCCKLIRVLFAIGRKKTEYNPVKLISDIRRPQLQEAA